MSLGAWRRLDMPTSLRSYCITVFHHFLVFVCICSIRGVTVAVFCDCCCRCEGQKQVGDCPSSGSPLWMGPYGENARVLETKVWRQSHEYFSSIVWL